MRGQVNMADKANSFNFWSTGCVMCGWALSWRRIGPILLTNASCRHFSFRCISLICWAYCSDVMVFPDSDSYSGSDGQQTSKQWPCPFFRISLALGSALELLLSPTITSCHTQSTFHCTLQSNWEVVHCSCKE